MCKRETLKQQILGIADDWISNCNDDICYNVERLLEPNAEQHLRELYDRKIALTKFRMSFALDIQVGPQGYDREILSDIISYMVEQEESTAG